MGQGRGIIGGKSSSFTTHPFKYSSISSECKQPNHEDYKATEQVKEKAPVYVEFGSSTSLILRKLLEASDV